MTAPGVDLPLVLVADHADPTLVARARERFAGRARVEVLPTDAGSRIAMLEEADVLLVFAWGVPRDELEHLRRVRLVQSVWAGVDRIPVRTIAEGNPGVVVAGGPGPNATQVAEHAVALYLDCAKRVSWRDRQMRKGAFPQETPSRRIAGSRVAVLGYGAIGRRVAKALDALGADVVAVTRDGTSDDGRTAITMDACRQMRATFDGMVLALPLTTRTQGLVDAEWLDGMQDDAILVNVARGRLIDEAALYDHLVQNPGFQAGLDVWWHYPKKGRPGFEQDVPFAELDNVVMTPHAAFHVPGTRDEMVDAAVDNVARFLATGSAERAVDIAECVR